MIRTGCLALLTAFATAMPAVAEDGPLWTPVMEGPTAAVGMERAPATRLADGTLETRVMIVYRAPQVADYGVWQAIAGRYRVDCEGRQTSVMDGNAVTADGQVVATQSREAPEWAPLEPDTPSAAIMAVLCDGQPMPDGPVWDAATFVAQTRNPDAPTPAWPRQPSPPPVPTPTR